MRTPEELKASCTCGYNKHYTHPAWKAAVRPVQGRPSSQQRQAQVTRSAGKEGGAGRAA